ncbi:hypothetical protein ACFQJ7_16630 [Halovenus rubra]|uniref:Uncharacterized protein n=2 Tax=Halovenus rubra TaxID=869890 RepID=A0ACC7DVN3_9EURY|nr:hypothetical protein [Halovenus rubra]
MSVRTRLSLSEQHQRQLSRAMQLTLFGLLFVALERQEAALLVTVSVGLAVTFLPALLERDHEIPMNAGLTLWITGAAFLHTIGVVGIPGTGQSLYGSIPIYDNMTHALSASVVAAAGYATVRAFDEHADGIDLPARFMFVFILVFVTAFGVVWELLEFSIAEVAQALGSNTTGFTQHGLDDTLLDLVFDAIGGVVVAIWGTAHLTDLSDALWDRLTQLRAE